MDFLQVSNGKIVDEKGKEVRLRGVNLGNWLLIEGYMLCGPNEPEKNIRRNLGMKTGAAGARKFFQQYQDAWIKTDDLKRIKRWGFNVVRVPFNYRLFIDSPEGNFYARNGWDRLTWLVRECAKIGLYCLLDMHSAPGGQNPDWHGDPGRGKTIDGPGRAGLWDSEKSRQRMIRLWKDIAARFKDEPAVVGYDIVNEPSTDRKHKAVFNQLYRDCAAAIRSIGDRHIIFLEGLVWSTDFSLMEDVDDEQVAITPHFYMPHAFSFNWELDLKYPGKVEGVYWDKARLKKTLLKITAWARKRNRPILMGEFGVNTRCPSCHAETRWVKDVVDIFEELKLHWTYWSYKVISGHMHPSGLMRFARNPHWVRREGITLGWENFPLVSPKDRNKILFDMDSKNFREDTAVLKTLTAKL